MKKVKIYIAGKITGEPIQQCVDKFTIALDEIVMGYKKTGWTNEMEIVNPLRLDGIYFDIPHADAMMICMRALQGCTHIYMLRDWRDSPGAYLEHKYAKENGLKIIYQE